jgi:hypothetical protein
MKLWIDTIYNQRDPKWASKLLGFNKEPKYTIGDYGCLITTISTYLTAIKLKETPETLDAKLKALGADVGYVKGTGLYIWSSLAKIHPDVTMFYESPRWDGVDTPQDAFDSMRDLIENGYFVIIEVDFDPTLNGEQSHFVGGCGVDEKGEILIADPWTGTLVPLSTYGDPVKSVYSFKTYAPIVPEEVAVEPYPDYKLLLWRFGRVFVAGAIGAVTVTALTTALNMETMQAVKYVAVLAISGGLAALSKYLRDKYGEDITAPINKLIF